MPFSDSIKEEALVKSRRCCCLCNDFAGVYVNVHHIVPEGEGGPNTLENAIVLCLKCHGEVGHYNNAHPIGNKYSKDELKKQRDIWWKWCEDNPAVPLPKNPVSVSPFIIQLAQGEWLIKSPLNVYNRENRFYYQVWVKLGFETDYFQFDDIAIDFIRGHDDMKLRAGPIESSASIFQMRCIDNAGRKAIFLVISALEPHSIYAFQIRQLTAFPISNTKPPSISCAISGFTEEPPKMGEGTNKSFLTFTPPENCKVMSLSLLLRRIPI